MTSYQCTEGEGRILFSDDRLELAFDRESGRWLWMRDLASGENVLHHGSQQAAMVLSVNGVTTATRMRNQWPSVIDAETCGLQAECTGYECDETDEGVMLTLHTRDGDWLVDQIYVLATDVARVERRLRVEYQGQGEALLRGADLRVPPAMLGPVGECFIEAPCYPTAAHRSLGSLPTGEYWDRVRWDVNGTPGRSAPGWVPGLIGLDNPSKEVSLAVWAYDRIEMVMVWVRRGDHGTVIGHQVMLADRFERGHAVEWKGQYIQLFHKPWMEALKEFQRWYDEAGVVAVQGPDWAKTGRIYELFIGINERRLSNKFPEMEDLVADLPRIKDLGFNVVEIMPHQPFPTYSVFDYHDVDTHYGSAEGLKKLTAKAHDMGMKVFLDVTIHGVLDQEAVTAIQAAQGRAWWLAPKGLPERHPYRTEHPEWFMQTEFGTPAATYTWAFDHCNEGWRDFMVEVFKHYVTEYDVDGFRVDALVWNCFPNWARGLPYRCSAPVYGSAEMTERAREAVQQIKPGVVFYTETPGPLFMGGYDLIYNYDMQWLFSSLVTPISPRGFAYTMAFTREHIEAADVGLWLEQHRLAKPEAATIVHHLDSHDTNEWGGLMQYRREAFGEQASRALFAFCCSLQGPLMMFMGAEDGAEEFYRKMLHLVTDLPALERGSCDYLAISADDPHIFAPLRTYEGQVVVPVINIQGQATEATLSLPVHTLAGSSYRVIDRIDDSTIDGPEGEMWAPEQLRKLTVRLSPWQVRMLEIQPARQ